MRSADVAVLGAGPAGLGAALRLARAGRSVAVLERGSGVGGLAASFDVGGVRVDHGSHRLHPTASPAVRAELDALLGDDLQVRRRNGRLRLADRWVAFPPRPGDLVCHLPVRVGAALARDAAFAPLRRPRADTFAEVVRAGLGPTMLHEFYAPYVRKIWDTAPEQLSGELARRRVAARSPGALLRKVVTRSRSASPGIFLYPRGGFGEIVERLAAAVSAAGGTICTGVEVTGIRADDRGATVTLGDGSVNLDAGHVLSTLPLTSLTALANAPDPVRAAAQELSFRALALVYLVVDAPRWTAYDAHYVPGPDAPFSRVSEPTRYRDSTDDPTDRTVLCAEVPCSVGDGTWDADDHVLGERVAEGLRRVGLPDASPVEVVVRRLPNAYPVYRVGYEERFGAVDAWAGTLPRLLTLGRQGLFAHDNTHHALAMGFAAADALAAGRLDAERWAWARAEFATHVVED